jgi:hypothetical protein
MKLPPSNGELEFWDLQRREELKTLIDEANSLGLDAIDIISKAPELYRFLKRDFNRNLIDGEIRSELDCRIAVLKTAILKAKGAQPSD